MIEKKKHVTMAIVGSLLAVMVLCGMAASAQQSMGSTDVEETKDTILDRAILIDSGNIMLVGKEVQDDTPLTVAKGVQERTGEVNNTEANKVVESFVDEVVQPANIENFEVVDNTTAEMIIPNGSAATFGQSDTVGWKCNVGDELVYKFEKYPSEVVNQQILVVGYILDGVMYPGENFFDLDGEYRHKVEENGEYFIYVINAASDPLSLKNGIIHIIESEEKK